jgi:hypothetical protein
VQDVRAWELAVAMTTPAKLRATRAAVVLACLLWGVAAVSAVSIRGDATHEIATRIEPLSADATELYRSLADADATVVSGFLAGGLEPDELRLRYEDDVERAGVTLASAGAQAAERRLTLDRISDITAALPVYTGLVEQARANNRQGLPVAVAYLRRASDLMQSTILPGAEAIQRDEAERLDEEFERAGSVPFLPLLLSVATLAGLGVAQVFVARRSHRVFNIGLLAATAAVLIGLVWSTIALALTYRRLESARQHSQAVTDALGPAQIAALQGRASESLALVGRDTTAYEEAFASRAQRLARADGAGGALGAARRFASDEAGRARVESAVAATRTWLAAHEQLRAFSDNGQYAEAVRFAIGSDPAGSTVAFNQLDASLADAVAYERSAFAADIARARGALTGLVVGTGLLAAVAAAGATWGIAERLQEYR